MPAGTAEVPRPRDRAANVIIGGMRTNVARKIEGPMLESGSIWRTVAADLRRTGRLGAAEPLTIERLSKMNMSALRRQLGQLTEKESAFFERFTAQRFFATHFTNATLHRSTHDGETMSLLSRQKLQERGVEFPHDNSTSMDIEVKADDGHVFFALDCGDSLQKLDSRFGDGLYRVPFDAPVFRQAAWGALDDLIDTSQPVDVERRLPKLDADEVEAIKVMIGPQTPRKENNAAAFADVFAGKDLVAAAGLSLIAKLRGVDEQLAPMERSASPGQVDPLVERFLHSRTPKAFNALLSLFHRVEIRVPGHFFSTDFQHVDAAALGLMQMTRNPRAVLKSPRPEKLKALANFCQGSHEETLLKFGALRDLGIDVARIRGDNRQTLLHMLCSLGVALDEAGPKKASILKMIPALVDYGLDVNARTGSGLTPLASALHDADLAAVLIENGADVNAPSASGATPLFSASGEGVAELLVFNGADIHHRDAVGRTALHFALEWFDLGKDLFRVLAASGLPIDEVARDQILDHVPAERAYTVPQAYATPAEWIHFFEQEAAWVHGESGQNWG